MPIAPLVRVARLDGPFVYLAVENARAFKVGQILRVYADGKGQAKAAIDLTITEIDGTNVQALFDRTKLANIVAVGDYVEPLHLPK